ncbi:MAG: hypothetical protein WBY94_04245 [Polyangiaceae bacterium]
MNARSWLALAGTSIAWAPGCWTVYGLEKYTTARDAGVPSSAASDPSPASEADQEASAEDAAPCDADQTTSPAAACTNATCVPFDNTARIQGYMPGAPLPSLPDDGPPTDASSGDGGVDAAGPGEAGTASGPGSPPACSTLPSPVYVVGSTGLTGLAGELGQLTSPVPITVVFVAAKSCDGAKAIILNKTAFDLGATTATYWDAAGTAHTCLIDEASSYADIGLGQLFADACLTLPQGTPGIGDFLGPITPIDIVVPTASTQSSISAEALYYTVGLGAGSVAPWTDPTEVFFNPGSGPQYDVALAIGVPPTQWKGTTVATAAQNIAKVGTSPDPESTLGLIGADLVEAPSNTSTLKPIAYQDVGQPCGYYPNATATSSEKQNVRDGHYPLWGFSHMFAKVNAQDVPLNPTAASIIAYFTGQQPTPTGDFLRFVVSDHLLPLCAMRVTRATEMGRLLPYAPSPSCGCYFDSITKGTTTCQVCKTPSDCPSSSPHCNLGYCEAH